ncbi:MAG: cytidylate kinase-like family protein [Lachnospiraceae bacterium]|nr:cytidylate kinase-like family protein [Lachnospiraceae bacterium]
MGKQLLISLGREFGSGGHKIAQRIAEEFSISYYDHNILDHMYENDEELIQMMKKYDEKKANPLLNRRVRGHSSSLEENLAMREFEFIEKKAEEGESFVIVGRCGETILREYPCHISFFVLGDIYDKIMRVQERCQVSEREAIEKIMRHDRHRKKFHNAYSDTKWGDARGYDLCVNVSRLGLDGTTEFLLQFIRQRMELMK